MESVNLEAMHGPNWEAVRWILDRAAVLTTAETEALAEAVAAWDVAWDVAWYDAQSAAWSAGRPAVWSDAWDDARDAPRDAAQSASVWDLAADDGPFTFADRDLLIGPWEAVIGLPPTLTRS